MSQASTHDYFESQAAGRWAVEAQREKTTNLRKRAERLKADIETAIIDENKSPEDEGVKAWGAELSEVTEALNQESVKLWSLRAKLKLQFGEQAMLDELEDSIKGWI